MIQWRFASFFGLLAVLGARCPLPSPTTAGFLVQILSMFFSVLFDSDQRNFLTVQDLNA